MPRLEQDDQLEFEADKSGMIHVRKKTGDSKVLPGYGTTEFGVSPFEEKNYLSKSNLISAAGIVGAGLLIWKLKNRWQVLSDYALLLRESYRS